MSSVEEILGAGHDVRLGKRQAHEVLQKLRARGAESEAADRLESRLADSDEVVIARERGAAAPRRAQGERPPLDLRHRRAAARAPEGRARA